jgi:hypothetical protein
MGRSGILGGRRAPARAAGRDTTALGPSDRSDSGSDTMGMAQSDGDPGLPVDVAMGDDEPHPLQPPDRLAGDSDAAGTGQRRSAGADGGLPDGSDIGVDRVFTPGGDADAQDEDPDLSFVDEAQAEAPLDAEEDDTPDAIDATVHEDDASTHEARRGGAGGA